MDCWVFAPRACVRAFWVCALLGAGIVGSSPTQAQEAALDSTLAEARGLIDQRRSADAYALLARHELEWGGTPLYDYLLGLSALDSGKARDAQFALDRVVAAQPDFAGARMELARAHFELGQLEEARTQFRFLLTQSPPDSTRLVIDRYLHAIDNSAGVGDARWSALVQFGAGYDSNANGSTDQQDFLGFTLNPRNIETDSSFGELTLDVGNTLPLGTSSGLVSRLQLSHRANPDASFIDQSIASLSTMFVHVRGANRLSAGVDGYGGWLDGNSHEHGANLNLGLGRRTGNDYELALDVRGGSVRYQDDALEILDVNRVLAGFSVTRVNIGERSGRAGVVAIGGRDDPRESGSPYANDRYGARLFASMLLRPQASVYVELAGTKVDYTEGTFFGVDRQDDQYGATLAFDFQNWPVAKWGVTPRVRYVSNDSSVALYDYDRVEAVVFVRRSF